MEICAIMAGPNEMNLPEAKPSKAQNMMIAALDLAESTRPGIRL